jgi:hypothetical protein
MKFAMPDLPCNLIFEFMGMKLPPNETDYTSPTARTARTNIIMRGASILGSLEIRQYLRERQR